MYSYKLLLIVVIGLIFAAGALFFLNGDRSKVKEEVEFHEVVDAIHNAKPDAGETAMEARVEKALEITTDARSSMSAERRVKNSAAMFLGNVMLHTNGYQGYCKDNFQIDTTAYGQAYIDHHGDYRAWAIEVVGGEDVVVSQWEMMKEVTYRNIEMEFSEIGEQSGRSPAEICIMMRDEYESFMGSVGMEVVYPDMWRMIVEDRKYWEDG